ncbi:hypothetical protein [Altericroceibacterium endophyticum]|uniref:Uncharacterized protein n=1 Tax=Altericroceibacterium endophyticum TaxID=1808508 RepID=A0A6I4T7P0_9SPHN|nr:hypothetical protein [Altericroceibacterium endophyticum]MXO66272.1 hypothetical protein [Altericroceibacterium endophyticum]
MNALRHDFPILDSEPVDPEIAELQRQLAVSKRWARLLERASLGMALAMLAVTLPIIIWNIYRGFSAGAS